MIKTPSSTAIGGAGIWTPGCTVIGGQQNIDQLIKSLFSDGTQGIYLNAQDAVSVSDLSSIKDLSGRNNHAAQPNATSRATLITDPSGYKSLKFDGIDDGYVTQSIDFSNTDKVTVIAAVRKLSDLAQMIISTSVDPANTNGTFELMSGVSPVQYGGYLRGTLRQGAWIYNIPELNTPSNAVISGVYNIGGTDKIKFTANGKYSTYINSSVGEGNLSNQPVFIGRRAGTSIPLNGQIYALLVIGKILDKATTQRIEKEFAKYIGVTL